MEQPFYNQSFSEGSTRSRITQRELQIIEELCLDFTVKIIADRLCLSDYTVNDHIKNAKRKLNVHTVNGLIAKCFRENIIV